MKHLILVLFILLISAREREPKPTLFLIGDSTVKNGSGKGEGSLWGWGDFLHTRFDTSKIHLENHARGGRSSRTYQAEGLWDRVLERIKPGDYVIIQFGHNDAGAVNDTIRARGTLKGIGDETEEIENMLTKKHETVHTYGWYMRKYIVDTKAKGATPIVCSLVARNIWKDGKVERATSSYASWAKEVAEKEAVAYIDLNDLVAAHYERLGIEVVTKKLFISDQTHTNAEGAKINAGIVADALRKQKSLKIKKYLL
jgi:lysophospholipase L1-like esterase